MSRTFFTPSRPKSSSAGGRNNLGKIHQTYYVIVCSSFRIRERLIKNIEKDFLTWHSPVENLLYQKALFVQAVYFHVVPRQNVRGPVHVMVLPSLVKLLATGWIRCRNWCWIRQRLLCAGAFALATATGGYNLECERALGLFLSHLRECKCECEWVYVCAYVCVPKGRRGGMRGKRFWLFFSAVHFPRRK